MTRMLVIEDVKEKYGDLIDSVAAMPPGLAPEVVRRENVAEVVLGGRDALGRSFPGMGPTEFAEFDLVLVDFGLQTARFHRPTGVPVELLLPGGRERSDLPIEMTRQPINLTTGIGVLLYLTQMTADPAFVAARGNRGTPNFWLYGAQIEPAARLAVAAAQAWFGCLWFPYRLPTDQMADHLASILDATSGAGTYVRKNPADRVLQRGWAAAAALEKLTECLWPHQGQLTWPATFDAYTWLRELYVKGCAYEPSAYWTTERRNETSLSSDGLVWRGEAPNQTDGFYNKCVDPVYVGLRNVHAAFSSTWVDGWPPDRDTWDRIAPITAKGRKEGIRTAPIYATLRDTLTNTMEFWTAEDVEAALQWHRAAVHNAAVTAALAAPNDDDLDDMGRQAGARRGENRWRDRLYRSYNPNQR